MAKSTVEVVLAGLHYEGVDPSLVAESEEIAAVQAEARDAGEVLDAEPATATLTTLPQQLEVVTTSLLFEA